MEFEWDERKAESNLAKHGVCFDQAVDALDDPDALEVVDRRVDYGEERVILTGRSASGVLVIVYTERDSKIRIISARKASRSERDNYYRQKAR
jgi:uncharacterized protein